MIMAAVLILAVLIQPSKGDMVSGMSNLGQFQSVFGNRKTLDTLSKITYYIAIGIFILTIATNLFFLPKQGSVQKAATEKVSVPTSNPRTGK